MKTIKPFIDAGWHTVPLKGQLKRLDSGKKTTPEFPKNFKEKYRDKFNEKDTAIGGVITGPCSNIIAIDCDSPTAYTIFRTLDPDYECLFISKGKPGCGTIIYEYTPELEDNFIVKNGEMNLDFYTTGGFVYLPTVENTTKETWTKFIKPKPAPESVIGLLKSLKPREIRVADLELEGKKRMLNLAPLVTKLIDSKKIDKALFKILTPKDFRDSDQYVKEGYLHPLNIPDGRGSEYLSKVSAVLGADESIDEEMYHDAMIIINDHFDEPMKKKRLMSTVIEPMVEEKATIGDEVIWRYNKDWEANIVTIITKVGTTLNLFYDMERQEYYAVDQHNERVGRFSKDSEFFSHLEVVATDIGSKKEMKQTMPLVKVVSSPKYPFGFFGESDDAFNTFMPTVPLTVFKNPEIYTSKYSKPETTLAFIESLIPDAYMRNYLYKFLRRKFDKFDYSPVVLYFLGASGSGKDLFVELLSLIIGEQAIAKPTAKEFIETHNGWMLDKYFAQLDEYGDQLSRFDEQENAKGRIKAWSGKREVSIRQMRTDGFPYQHNITFVLTANKNPLTFDTDDRRIALFDCPNALRYADAVQAVGLEEFVRRLKDEINDFAYWLSTERENATLDEYMGPPETEDKKRLIASRLNAGAQIAYFLSNNLFQELAEVADRHEVHDIFASAGEGKIFEDDLFDLYMEMTNGQGTKRGLTLAMKQFDKIPTTKAGNKAYYYKVPTLATAQALKFTPVEGDFE